MKVHAAFLAVVFASAASTAAFAASNPKDLNHPSSREGWSVRCASLDAQFDALMEKHASDANFEAASALHSDGVSACQSSESTVGVGKLEEAIRKLGVEPAS